MGKQLLDFNKEDWTNERLIKSGLWTTTNEVLEYK